MTLNHKCSATTATANRCSFRGLHVVDGKFYCGNHANAEKEKGGAWSIASPKEAKKQMELPLDVTKLRASFNPTQESASFAKLLVGLAKQDGSEAEAIVAYALDGYVANVVRKLHKE